MRKEEAFPILSGFLDELERLFVAGRALMLEDAELEESPVYQDLISQVGAMLKAKGTVLEAVQNGEIRNTGSRVGPALETLQSLAEAARKEFPAYSDYTDRLFGFTQSALRFTHCSRRGLSKDD